MNIEQRLRELEKATAIAYLDTNLSGERYAAEAKKVTEALAEGQHFRLVIATIEESSSVHATIEIESDQVTFSNELATEETKNDG